MEDQRTRESLRALLLPLALILGLVLILGLDAGEMVRGEERPSLLEQWLRLGVGYLAAGAEIAAALTIGVATLRGALAYTRSLLPMERLSGPTIEEIRLRMGRGLTLGLEFAVASDILRTIVAPTRQDILTLAAIVMLRTLINTLLEREIAVVEARQHREIEDA